MRVGFFTDGFLPRPDGVATSVYETARELVARGHEVIVVAPKYPGYVDRDLTVIRLPSLKVAAKPETRLGISLPDRHLRRILDIDFDLIHGHSGGPVTLLGWEIARTKNIPFVVTNHTLWNRYTHYFLKGRVVSPKMMEQATKIFGNQSDCIIAPSIRVEKELKSYGVKKPIKVVPSGINIEKFANAKHGFLRSKLKLAEDTPLLLFVGRLGHEKSVDFILRSFKKVLDRNKEPHLAIVGDGPQRSQLEQLAKKLKIQSNTHFLGEVERDRIQEVYPDATVFVFSSTTETQGLVVPEALASGVPIVAIDDPAYDIVKNGENGYLAKHNEAEFSSKILSIITNKRLREKMSKNAKETSQKLSVKSAVSLLESVYLNVLDKHNKESVSKIMLRKERNEAIFVVNLVFWATVILTRLTIFLYYNSIFYPKFAFLNHSVYHASIGIVLVLLFLALFVKKRAISLLPLIFLGVGLGFMADDIVSMVFSHIAIFDYWNPLNLAIILTAGVIPLFFSREKQGGRPKFYLSSKIEKHINPKNPKASVVIPAYNEGKFIETTLKSIVNQTYKDFELIVVDNNSTDNTAEVAKSFGAKVVFQKTPGVAGARQKGFMAAKGKVICSTDADSLVPQDWVEKIVERYERNKNLVGFGGLANLYSGPVTARAAGRFLFPLFWRLDKAMSGGWNMSGFNMSARKSAFLKIGGFNTELKMGEDIDLSEKLRKVGQIKIDPSLIVFASGRRYSSGLLPGLMVYAPWWISKVVLRHEKPFEFPAVRSEHGKASSIEYLPLYLVILLLAVLFYFGNTQY